MKNKLQQYWKRLSIVVVILNLTLTSFGQTEHFYKRLITTPSHQLTVTDNDHVFVSGTGYQSTQVDDYLTLGIDHNWTDYLTQPYQLEVDVNVVPATGTSFNTTLAINYYPFKEQSYQDLDTYVFQNMDDYTFTITAIRVDGNATTLMPKNVYLEGGIDVKRAFDFTTSAKTPITFSYLDTIDIDCDSLHLKDEIKISWNDAPGSIEYQLEWTFVNDYDYDFVTSTATYISPTNLAYDFRENATRVTTTATNYTIPLLFNHGYILFRVRAIGVDQTSQNSYLTGVWSTDVVTGGVVTGDKGSGIVNDFETTFSYAYYHVTTPHEENKNWQVTTTFAEEGKKKEVASYYDGSLRNRQSVTVVNSDKNVIVGETVYDYQGRPAVNILPVPVLTTDVCGTGQTEASIKYYPQFNKNTAGTQEYSKSDFDLDGVNCTSAPTTTALNQNSGAGEYYSVNNINQNNEQAYVPDANGYPFTVVEYTPDNTGRVRSQSGVGENFKLGAGHESKYFYGKPDQIQLDRLFASEVGYAEHYKKNMVIDPNGQVSVSYLDQEGRVVATSLAGQKPTNLDAIDSYSTSTVTLHDDMITANSHTTTSQGNVNDMNFSQSILVSEAATYHFVYNISADVYQDACVPTVCFNCYYDLKLTLTDDCGAPVYDNSTPTPQPVQYIVTKGHFVQNQQLDWVFAESCDGPYSDNITFDVDLAAGNYNLNKIISVNTDAAQYYLDSVILDSTQNTCFQTLYDFQQAALSQIDTTNCYLDCQTCLNDLGSKDDFIAAGRGTAEDYDELYEECEADCQEPTFCETIYGVLLGDVSPGGQYGLYQNSSYVTDPNHPLSVYNTSNLLLSSNYNWLHPQTLINGVYQPHYYDENDNIVYVTNTSGALVEPQSLTLDEFVDNWDDSWARALVLYHPEFGYYQECIKLDEEDASGMSSEKFDAKLRAMTFDQAVTAGYLTGDHTNGYTVNIQGYDPFIQNTGGTYHNANLAQSFTTALTNYAYVNNSAHSYDQIAAMTAYYGTQQIGNSSIPSSYFVFGVDNALLSAADNATLHQQAWNTLVAMYLGKKQEVINLEWDAQAITNGCFNDCIGNQDFTPYAKGFYNPTLSIPSYISNPYFDGNQPCSFFHKNLYKDKQKRFSDVNQDLSFDQNELNYQVYAQTGLCPAAINFQSLFNEIAESGDLLNNISLENYGSYPGLVLALSHNEITTTIPAGTMSATIPTTDEVDLSITINGQNCITTLQSQDASAVAWANATGFSQIFDVVNTGTAYTFTITVELTDPTTLVKTYVPLNGSTCFPIAGCNFAQECTPNDLALQTEDLLSLLASEGELLVPSYTLSSGIINLLGTQITNRVGTTNLVWQFDGTNKIGTLTNSVQSIQLNFSQLNAAPGESAANISYFDNLNSSFENNFSMTGRRPSGALVMDIAGTAQYYDGSAFSDLIMGDCGAPSTEFCDAPENQNLYDLQSLINTPNFFASPNSIDLISNNNFTAALASYAPGITSTTSSEAVVGNDIVLTINNGNCDIILTAPNTLPTYADIFDIVSVTASGNITNNNLYEFTIVAWWKVSYYATQQLVTITGTSCIPLQNCDNCNNTSGQPVLPSFKSVVRNPAPLDTTTTVDSCYLNWTTYSQLISDFNNSDYASVNNVQLYVVSYDSIDCKCISDYIDYIIPYLSTPANLSLPIPVNYLSFTCPGGAAGPVTPANDCGSIYTQYTDLVTAYNDSVNLHGDSTWVITDNYTKQEFKSQDLCYCYESFAAHINYLLNNNFPNGQPAASELAIADFCANLPCTPTSPPPIVNNIPIPYSNPCVQNMIQTAMANGENAYNNYVTDLSTAFLDNYIQHCQSTLNEGFSKEYSFHEYHYTLYYYDQAGNLIKTVPPAGVELLGLDVTNDPSGVLAAQINNDRNNHQQTVFTDHRLATKYMYNSLNQLVKQSLPDHDQMDIWNETLPNGLDANLRIQEIQYLNANKGYLVGYIPTTYYNRGMLYTTDNGGKNWKRVNDVVASSINSSVFYGPNKAYYMAVGDNGTVLSSLNAASSWDVLTVANGSTPITSNLNDVIISSALGNAVIVGDNSTIFRITNTFSVINVTPVLATGVNPIWALTANDNITSIYYNTSTLKYSISVDKLYNGKRIGVTYTSPDLTTWTPLENVFSKDALAVQQLSSTEAVIAGNKGLILSTNDGGANWYVNASDITGNIQRIVYADANTAVLLIDNELYYTLDGGATATLLDNTGTLYTSLKQVGTGTAGTYAIATTNSDEVARIIIPAGSPATIDKHTVNSIVTHAILLDDAAMVPGVSSQPTLAVDGSSDIFFTRDINFIGGANWTTVSTSSYGITAINSINAVQSGNHLYGVFIDGAGLGYMFDFDVTSASFNAAPTQISATDVYTTMSLSGSLSIDLYNSTGNSIDHVDFTSGIPTPASIPSQVLNTATTVDQLSVNGSISTVINSTGQIVQVTASETDQSFVVRPPAFTDFAHSSTDISVGKNGTFVNYTTTNNELIRTESREDLNAVGFTSTSIATLVGNNGSMATFNNGFWPLGTGLNTVASPTTEDLYDVCFNATDQSVISGNNGTMLYSSGLNVAYQTIGINESQPLYEASIDNNLHTLYAGGASHINYGIGSFAIHTNQVFPSKLTGVNYVDANHGGVVGAEGFFARTTSNGNQSFAVLQNSTSEVLTGIAATANNVVLIGQGGFLAQANYNSSTVSTITPSPSAITNDLNDIHIVGNNGYIVGNNVILSTSDAGANWATTTTTANLKNMHYFDHNNSFIAVTATDVQVYNPNTPGLSIVATTSGQTLNDIAFYDDVVGYVVGDNNYIAKANSVTWNNGSDRIITGMGLSVETLGTTGNNIKSIAIAERYNLMLGGNNSTTTGFAELIKDESMEFSTYFYYDKLGRIVVSQNSKQYAESPNKKYSYTLYDGLGRVVEAGEKEDATGSFGTIFGSVVSHLYNPNVIDDAKLNTWITDAGARTQVTHSYYDHVNTSIQTNLPGTFVQNDLNLRKRISAVTYEDVYDGSDATYDYASHYDYDIHGNVKTLLQDNQKLAQSTTNTSVQAMQFKRMDYDYDLISGNVNEVSYQAGQPDQWHHRYQYDADNRIQSVQTSDDYINWAEDARYFYYDHGPLARVELGDDNVQGIDYAYTLQGWLKGVNSDLLDPNNDIGKDGAIIANNLNQNIARDAFGFSLNYFSGDYSPIDATYTGTAAFNSNIDNGDVNAAVNTSDLYNGNIKAMVTTIKSPMDMCTSTTAAPTISPQATAYQYDQLNRLSEARAFVNVDNNSQNATYNSWLLNMNTADYIKRYYNKFTYDANGNIASQVRKDQAGVYIDDLTYQYADVSAGKRVQNRLYHVNDNYNYDNNDIDDMGLFNSNLQTINDGSNNYRYDQIGQLTQDKQEEIYKINWRVDGKISAIIRAEGSVKKNMIFDYDPMGNRIAKHIYGNQSFPTGGGNNFDPNNPVDWEKSTYYNRDAQGNVISIYEYTIDNTDPQNPVSSFMLDERNIYGSSRVGMNKAQKEMIGATLTVNGHVYHNIGEKEYELSNHLGNVLAVISDRKFAMDYNSDLVVDYYEPDMLLTYDYSPFGVILPERNITKQVAHDNGGTCTSTPYSAYRYGFQGQERDDEVKGAGNSYNFKYRMHDPRLGRFFAIDPLTSKYPYNSPYAFSENRVIDGIELEGKEYYYTSDGTLLGNFGTSTQVRVINDNSLAVAMAKVVFSDEYKTNYGVGDQENDWLTANSSDAGMTNEELNARAYLTVIRKGEGTLGDDGYTTLFGGEQFEKTDDHPNKTIKKGSYTSTAAGAYQILKGTWSDNNAKNAKNNLGISDFSPESQDKFALWLIAQKGGLDEVTEGDFEGAVDATNKTWASLPGSPYGQPVQTMDGAKKVFKDAIANELKGESEIATPAGELQETIDELQ